MSVLLSVFGLVFGAMAGAVLASGDGAVAGALLGLLTGMVLGLQQRATTLERELSALRQRVQRLAEDLPPADLDVEWAPEPAYGPVPQAAAGPGVAPAPGWPPQPPPEQRPEQRPEQAGPPPAVDVADAPPGADADAPSVTRLIPGLLRTALAWLRGGNPIVRVGIVVLFFGLAFLARYAVDAGLVPIQLRLAAIAAGGIGMLALGWRVRRSRPGFALPVQGGGVGVLFLTVFAAYQLYDLVPAGLAFTLMVLMVALTGVLAVLQGSVALAALGVTGGFLAPLLASTGAGSHVALFSYYLILNLLIVGVAWFRAWRSLNLLGFAFTFGIGTLWGAQYYRPELFNSTAPFLVAHGLLYTAVAVLFAWRQPPRLRGLVDGTLVFGTPLIGFALHTRLLDGDADALALSALLVAACYMTLAAVLLRRGGGGLRTLGEAFLANAVVFATLAIPLALDARWTAATWALEGAGLLWVGVRQQRLLPRLGGTLLQFLAGAALLIELHDAPWQPLRPFLNPFYLAALLVLAGGLFSAVWLHCHRQGLHRGESALATALGVWALLWCYGSAALETLDRAPASIGPGLWLAYLGLSAAALHDLAERIDWGLLRAPALMLLPALAVSALGMALDVAQPLAALGWLGWPLALGAQLLTLHRLEARPGRYRDGLHGGSVLLVAALAAWLVGWFLRQQLGGQQWPQVAWGLVPALLALLVTRASAPDAGATSAWPFAVHARAYLLAAVAPLSLWLWWWLLVAHVSAPELTVVRPYLPLLNPLDLACGFAVMAGVHGWRRGARVLGPDWPLRGTPALGPGLLGAMLFLWANAMLLRSIHVWAEVPYRAGALFASALVQTSVAVFWGVLGLVGMALAARRGLRAAWFVAAGLMAVVVVKLFLVDLANTGTLQRVVSFLSVGVALVAVGYFAPLPPRRDAGRGEAGAGGSGPDRVGPDHVDSTGVPS